MALQLTTKDEILTRIKINDLDVIIQGDDTLLDEPEADAMNEVSSYLSGRYDMEQIFNAQTKDVTIKRIIIDVLLYNLHTRVNPRNIPEKRIQLRDDAISWLKLVANTRSNVTADFLPKRQFQDKKGTDISWNSRKKRDNSY